MRLEGYTIGVVCKAHCSYWVLFLYTSSPSSLGCLLNKYFKSSFFYSVYCDPNWKILSTGIIVDSKIFLIGVFVELKSLLSQVILSEAIKYSISIIFSPPWLFGRVICFLFILSGLLSHKNLN